MGPARLGQEAGHPPANHHRVALRQVREGVVSACKKARITPAARLILARQISIFSA
jgi:hypothetical protein